MSFERARQIADAVLLEGYMLYPYRASSTKNRYRWTFGVVAPRLWSEAHGDEPWQRSVECLIAGARPRLRGRLRFLHVRTRTVEAYADGRFQPASELTIGQQRHLPWEEGALRELDFEVDAESPGGSVPLAVEAGSDVEPLEGDDAAIRGRLVRSCSQLQGRIATRCEPVASAGPPLWKVRLTVENSTEVALGLTRAAVMSSSLVSVHLLLAAEGGEFASAFDPPPFARAATDACRCDGLHPALVGPGRELLLCSPIILYDDPEIAPESPGDFFDATEIDELLALRTLTLTEEEKLEARAADARTKALLERVEALSHEELARLHGAVREFAPPRHYEPGMRVRLRPGARRTDAQDALFSGLTATIEEVRLDVDGRQLVGVTIDDDPATELHRWYRRFFYYQPDELELLGET